MKNVGHVRHFRWLGPNVWWKISQIYIEYIKPIRQMSDEPWKFFTYTATASLSSFDNWSESIILTDLPHTQCNGHVTMPLKKLPLKKGNNQCGCQTNHCTLQLHWPRIYQSSIWLTIKDILTKQFHLTNLDLLTSYAIISLDQVVASPLFGAKPLPEPMLIYFQLDS